MTHDWELCPASGRWAWVCACGQDGCDYETETAALDAGADHEVTA